MNGQPRINPGFMVGQHELRDERERRWQRYDPSKIVSSKLLRPKREVRTPRKARK